LDIKEAVTMVICSACLHCDLGFSKFLDCLQIIVFNCNIWCQYFFM